MKLITVAAFFGASLNAFGDNGFAYNVEMVENVVASQVVYRKSEDGKYLSHHLKYKYVYDEQGRLTEKEVLKWNAILGKWEHSHCLFYTYDVSGYSINYALWDEKKSGYAGAIARQVYDESIRNAVRIALYKWNESVKDWVIQDNQVMLNPDTRLLAQDQFRPRGDYSDLYLQLRLKF